MAFRWRADDGQTWNGLDSFVIFQGIPTSIAKEPYIFVIFQGGPDPLSPPPLDPHMTFMLSKFCTTLRCALVRLSVQFAFHTFLLAPRTFTAGCFSQETVRCQFNLTRTLMSILSLTISGSTNTFLELNKNTILLKPCQWKFRLGSGRTQNKLLNCRE